MELKIYNQTGAVKAIVSPDDNSTHKKSIMEENVVSLSFTLYEFLLLEVNDYIIFDQEKFTLLDEYRPEQNSTIEYKYDVKFYGVESELKKALVLKLVDGVNETAFDLTDNAAVHLQVVVDNVNRIKGTLDWQTGEVVASINKTISYDCTSCFEALNKIAEAFDTEWWIEGNTIHLSRCEHGNQIELGYMKGLQKLSKTENETAPFFTRLYPIGSSRNIYKDKYGYSRLRLPGGAQYVEQNTHLGIVEYSEESAFSHIYPRRIGTVGTVRSEQATGEDGKPFTIYYFTDPSLTFDPNDYEIPALVKGMVFQSGELNGYDFEVNFDSKTKEFEVITQFPSDDIQLPGGLMIPKKGDEYILYNITMPSEYYPMAEKELKEAVDDFLAKYSIDVSVYKAPTDYLYIRENAIDLRLGRRVKLLSQEYFTTGSHDSRVVGITRKINNPEDMDLECSYSVASGRFAQLENTVVDIQTAFKEQLNKEKLQVLKSWDSSDPTEYNVLSAVRTIRAIASSIEKLTRESDLKYLRKDIADSAAELITFLDGIHVVGGALIERLISDDGAIFREWLSSEKFVSGFPAGTGWALLWKEVENAAGIQERKATLEIDEVTVRGAMRIYELIISQLSGENGTRLTTDMMKVASLDRTTKTIYLDTEKGVLYNPFKQGDILMVQQYGGLPTAENGYNMVKQYELVVTAAGIGSDGDDRLDWIKYDNFVGNLDDVSPRDVLTRADSLTNSDRKGMIKQTSIEPGSPYLDIIYGMKTDPDNAVRTRLGRLSGIVNYFWGQLQGYGLYSDNAYLLGDFRLRTGEDVRTVFEILEGMLRSSIQSVTYNLTEEDNYLSNATFTRDMECWLHDSNINLYSFGGMLLDMGYNLFSEKNTVAEVVENDGRQMLRLKNSHVRQLNQDIRKPEEDEIIMYLSFRYKCDMAGTLKVGFDGTDPDGDLVLQEFKINQNNEYQIFEITGEWDGRGDFVLQFSGDIYIDTLNFSNSPLEDYKKEVSSLFIQTDEKIEAVVTEVNNLDNYVKTAGWITEADGHQLWAKHETVDDLGNRLTTHESSFHVTATYIQGMVTAIEKVEDEFTFLDSYVRTAGWITTADGNKLWATINRVDLLGNQITTHLGQFHVTAEKIDGMVTSINTINNTISSAGWITTATGNTLWAKKELESGNTIVSYINQTATTVTISASRVNLVGYVTASNISAIDIRTSRLWVSNGAQIGSFTVDNSSLYWSSGTALIRLGYAGYYYQNSCIYAKSDFGGNAIVGIANMGGAGIYGSCRYSQTWPSWSVLWAGYFDGNVCVQNANLFVYGAIQANSVLPQNAWSGEFKGKTVTVQNGIITRVR